jgi:hypothetical protein
MTSLRLLKSACVALHLGYGAARKANPIRHSGLRLNDELELQPSASRMLRQNQSRFLPMKKAGRAGFFRAWLKYRRLFLRGAFHFFAGLLYIFAETGNGVASRQQASRQRGEQQQGKGAFHWAFLGWG